MMNEILREIITPSFWIYFGVSLAIGLLVVMAAYKCSLVVEDRNWDDKNHTLSIIVFLIPVIFVTPLTALALALFFGLLPPAVSQESITERAEDTRERISALGKQADDLRLRLADPREMTLRDMETTVQRVVGLSEELAGQMAMQQVNVDALLDEVEKERAKARHSQQEAEKSQARARELKSLTESQTEAIKALITEDTNRASMVWFIWGAIASLPLGIASSVLAGKLVPHIHLRGIGHGRHDSTYSEENLAESAREST